MRILHISNNYTPYAGGIVSSLNTILPTLQEMGHEVKLLVPQFVAKPLHDFSFVERIPTYCKISYNNHPYALPYAHQNRLKNASKRLVQTLFTSIIPSSWGILQACLPNGTISLPFSPIIRCMNSMLIIYRYLSLLRNHILLIPCLISVTLILMLL
jgi:hypothetical protein